MLLKQPKVIEDLRRHLGRLSTLELQKRFQDFRNLNFKSMNSRALEDGILKVLSVKNYWNNSFEMFLTVAMSSYPKGTKFFRIRKADLGDNNLPLKCLKVEQDVWATPKYLAKQGRMNKRNESILYTCPINQTVAFEEMNLLPSELCCLIVYEAKSEIKVAKVVSRPDFEDATEEENIKLNLIYDFLHMEFTRDVGEGNEHLYRLSETIAKNYFDLPPRDVQDAWCYPSVALKPHVNVCFREEIAREVLRVSFVLIGRRGEFEHSDKFNVIKIAEWSQENDCFNYYNIGSAEQKRLAPDIKDIKTNSAGSELSQD